MTLRWRFGWLTVQWPGGRYVVADWWSAFVFGASEWADPTLVIRVRA